MNQPLEKIRQKFQDPEPRADLNTRILRRKALELLVEHSAVTEE